MLLPLLVFLPLFAFLLTCCIPNHFEKIISRVALTSSVAASLMFVWTLILWIRGGFAPLSHEGFVLFSSAHYEFLVNFYMDTVSAVFFAMTCLTTILVLMFSRYYMHRDPGYKRFHATILFFFFGLGLAIFSGNFEMLFVGWEVIGISSYLLISFYRNRYLPAKNSLKVFSLYRIADALFIIALWYAHHLFEKNVQFAEFTSLIHEHGSDFAILGGLFLVAAMIKSAQFPFSYWVPRAMEGPTTSSAIFYGALSVHMGLFLLLRTYPLWEGSTALRITIAVVGIVTALIATSITRVQSSAKTQIAYASVTQIGIMFIELALGLHFLVLFHFVSNACLRTYQLLISPSIVSYLVHYQFYTFETPVHKIQNNFMGKIRSTLYILGIKEWNMDSMMTSLVWQPLKSFGKWLQFLDRRLAAVVYGALLFIGVYVASGADVVRGMLDGVIWVSAILSILLFVRAYATKGSVLTCWTQIFLGQIFAGVFLSALTGASLQVMLFYFTGLVVAYLIGVLIIRAIDSSSRLTLMEYHGYMHQYSTLGNVFFIACLAMVVFPITPSFIGEELFLSSIHTDHGVLVAIFAFGYVLSGISVMRLFAKIFFGPNKKTHHEIAYRSS
jgi:NADH:ubiquinone oxidoreductase subunit 5 (subunit L)/multisubunit Na+/H+ antiporter MnhA subunit